MTSAHFIDLFSGCGGLSLGLSQAGFRGLFAVERDSIAFSTFSHNFLSDRKVPIQKFEWPTWLEKKAWGIDDLLAMHSKNLASLANTVDVLAGGPPCQGFSFSGKRDGDDPRNQLFKRYVRVVESVMPKFIVLENVPGMRVAHISKDKGGVVTTKSKESYFEKLKNELEALGYQVKGEIINAADFGVPQRRSRLIVIGARSDQAALLSEGLDGVFGNIESARLEQLKKYKISLPVTVKDAISDLRSDLNFRKPCQDPFSRSGYLEASYHGPDSVYQKLMQKGARSYEMDSMRMANHSVAVAARFAKIIKECRKGVRMDDADRAKFGIRKQRICPMAADEPAPTITTLPDDILHYAEPRILTVRESARIQSFPDWFHFRGKFTTGGKKRRNECPRYTQIGNAVPPLLASAIGMALSAVLAEIAQKPFRAPVSLGNGLRRHLALAA